jgi:hypothetical protein
VLLEVKGTLRMQMLHAEVVARVHHAEIKSDGAVVKSASCADADNPAIDEKELMTTLANRVSDKTSVEVSALARFRMSLVQTTLRDGSVVTTAQTIVRVVRIAVHSDAMETSVRSSAHSVTTAEMEGAQTAVKKASVRVLIDRLRETIAVLVVVSVLSHANHSVVALSSVEACGGVESVEVCEMAQSVARSQPVLSVASRISINQPITYTANQSSILSIVGSTQRVVSRAGFVRASQV